ncbi:MAG TPA: DUF6159 family protein [Elusimicrobiota bacterium]|nr:DUF6159 family protein [Elusimicrobiota bacterium]
MAFLNRIQTSWRLMKSSLSVMVDHPKLLVFPAVITACTFGILLFFLAPVALQPTGHGYAEGAHWKAVSESIFTRESMDQMAAAKPEERRNQQLALTPQAMVYLAVIYFASMFLATFFTTAFYHEILSALQGGGVSVTGGLRFALTKLPAILMWSLFAGAIGYLIKSLEERVGLIGKWILRFIGVAWSVASVFAIPVLVMEEEKNPVAILKRSAETLKRTWGESLAGFVGLQFGGFIVIILTIGLYAVGIFAASTFKMPLLLLATTGLWIAGLFAFFYTLGVANSIYRCALYVFAARGTLAGPYDREAMDLAWKMKKK